jgi:hypothetical protein
MLLLEQLVDSSLTSSTSGVGATLMLLWGMRVPS